jgi:hypothetical protein
MPNVTFVAPFFLETTLRFVNAAASLPGVHLALVSQDPASKLSPGLRDRLAAHRCIERGLDVREITAAVQDLARELGPTHRLLGTLEELQVPLAEVRETLGIAGMSVEAARNFRDKARMKTVLQAAGLPCARHKLARSDEDAWEFAREVGFPIVIKPPAGSGARSTFRVDSLDALHKSLAVLPPSVDNPALLEEFITGEEHSFDSVCVNGDLVWYSISRYYPTPLEVLQNPWIQWVVILPREIDTPLYNEMRSVAARVLTTLGMRTGLSHMEWFRRRDGSVAVSEVAARPPGAQFTTLLSYAHDLDFYRAWAHLMVYEEFAPPPRLYAAGVAFLRGQGDGRVVGIRGLEEVRRAVAPVVVEAKLPREGQSPSGTYEGEGYVIVRHPETRVVEEALKRVVTTIRVELG